MQGKSKIDFMLPYSYNKYMNRIKYSCYIQPILKGTRLFLVIDAEGIISFYYKTGKTVENIPLLVKLLKLDTLSLKNIIFDGVVSFNGFSLKDILTKDLVTDMDRDNGITFEILDIPSEDTKYFYQRYEILVGIFKELKELERTNLRIAPTMLVKNQEEAEALYESCLDNYRGITYRNIGGKYIAGKSRFVVAREEKLQLEATILDIVEGEGYLKKCVAAFLVELPNKKILEIPYRSSFSLKKCLFRNPALWVNSKALIKYSHLDKNGIPLFAKIVSII